ncbi:MAG: (Fe-S)-binding protein [Candidatus Sumerlaeia bacterium]
MPRGAPDLYTVAAMPAEIPERPLPRRVHLMLTCLCDALFADVGRSVVRVLEHLGVEVVFDPRQTCCGQPAFNSGDWTNARAVARHTLGVFEDADCIVCPSGSCTAMVRWGYPMLFAGERDEARARALGAKTWDFTEFLWKAAGVREWPHPVRPRLAALHRSCHLRELGVGRIPERLLGTIPGLQLAAFDEQEQCCGFGGTFSVTFPHISRAMGCVKLDMIARSGATEIISGDMGCLFHLQGLARKHGRRELRATHIAQIFSEGLVDESFRQSTGPRDNPDENRRSSHRR